MSSHKSKLRSSTVMPIVLGASIAAGAALAAVPAAASQGGIENPPALSKTHAGWMRVAQCGAKKACNPCAAKKACNPCAAKKACNPCAAKKACNPCAAKKACNPCAAKKN